MIRFDPEAVETSLAALTRLQLRLQVVFLRGVLQRSFAGEDESCESSDDGENSHVGGDNQCSGGDYWDIGEIVQTQEVVLKKVQSVHLPQVRAGTVIRVLSSWPFLQISRSQGRAIRLSHLDFKHRSQDTANTRFINQCLYARRDSYAGVPAEIPQFH